MALALTRARASARSLPLPPGPRYVSPFSFLRELRADSLGFLERMQREYGDLVCMRIGILRSCILARPEHVRRVLIENHRNYWKGRLFGKLKGVAGDGLLFSEGEAWRRQRRMAAPAFQRSRVEGLVPRMAAVTNELLERWDRERAGGEDFDLLPEMSNLALDIVCRAMVGGEMPLTEREFHEIMDESIAYANHLINTFVPAPLWVPTARNRRMRRTLGQIDAVILELVRRARAGEMDEADLLGTLVEARDEENGSRLSDRELRDQMVTFLFAGHETTAVALTWAFHLLGRHPEVEAALRREADHVLSDAAPTIAEVARLEHTRRAMQETLRLYPPIWATARQAYEDDEIGGFRIPKGANVTISPWLIHRHPELWQEPERFDPDRFLPERAEERPRLAYLPFLAGGRRCIGEDFALLEATAVLAMILRRFEVRPVPGPQVKPDPILTLRPKDGLRVTLERR